MPYLCRRKMSLMSSYKPKVQRLNFRTMTQQEFQTRVQMEVLPEEFDAINIVYLNCNLDKDDFCKMWVKMNESRVKKAIAEAKKAQREAERKDRAYKISEKLRNLSTWHEELADNMLGVNDKKWLSNEGFEMQEMGWNGVRRFKTGWELYVELHNTFKLAW